MPRTKGSSNKKKNSTSTEVAPVPTSVAVPEDRDKLLLISDWKTAADQLAEVKAKEAALRQAIVAQMFDGTKLEGSETVDIGWGYQLRAKKELAYNASDKNGETKTLLEVLKTRGDVGASHAESLIRWKPEVAKINYREVLALAEQYKDNEILAALHAAITLKPGMPQLEMVPPKQETVTVVNTEHPTMTNVTESNVFTLEENFIPE